MVKAVKVAEPPSCLILSSEIRHERHFSRIMDFIWANALASPDFCVLLYTVDVRFFFLRFTHKDTKNYAHLQLFCVNYCVDN